MRESTLSDAEITEVLRVFHELKLADDVIKAFIRAEALFVRLGSIQSMTDTSMVGADGEEYSIDEVDEEISGALLLIESVMETVKSSREVARESFFRLTQDAVVTIH